MAVEPTKDMLDVVRVSLRVTSSKLDPEIEMLVGAALSDMERVGIDPEYLASGDMKVTHAVVCYCKSMFGYDNSGNSGAYGTNDSTFFNEAYRQHVCDMLNSQHNMAAVKQAKGAEDAQV